MIDRGIDILEPKRGEKRPRDETALEIMREIEGGRKYGEIRRAYPTFTFWYRRYVKDYINDELALARNPDYTPQ